jgi:hypothetical protein
MAADDPSRSDADARRARLLEEFVARLAPRAPSEAERVDRATAALFRALVPAGVDALLLKGPALEQALYRAGERRSYVDVDVLVAPTDRAKARRTLSELGYFDAHEPLGIDDVGRVVHAETWLGGPAADYQGTLIELHLWLAGATADPQEVWDALSAGRESVDVDGVRVPCPGRPGLAMGLALHAAQHGPTYAKGLAELVLGLERWPPDVWEAAAELAVRTGAVQAFAAGLRLVPEGADEARALGLPGTERADWEIRNAQARPRGTFHLRAFTEAERVNTRLAVLRRSLFPKRAWIVRQYRWARRGGWRVPVAYAMHVARAPLWALRAWRFTRRPPS